MNYIVLDMEWNQASTYAEMVKKPVFLTGEIIQIGAVKLDQDFQAVDSFDHRIVPRYYTALHPAVAEITGLSERDLRRGESFPDAFAAFCDWCGADFVFLIWGTEDLRILRKNMELYDMDTSFMPPCFNLQNVFAKQLAQNTKQYGLHKALDFVHETPYDAHDALNDAKSTTLVCRHLDMSRGLAEYQEIVEHRDGIVECYEFEEPYLDIADALSDDYVVSFECPTCGGIVWGDNWARRDGMTLLAPGQCDDGQEFLIRLKFRPVAGNRVVVKRTVFTLTSERLAEYQRCVEQTAAWNKYVIPAYAY